MNWLFIGLARTAGFEAAEVYAVPRNFDIFSPAGQNSAALTADLVWARAGGKEYWLDPAALYYPSGWSPGMKRNRRGYAQRIKEASLLRRQQPQARMRRLCVPPIWN